MLIGAVPYVNAIPLVQGLPYPVRKAPPAVLERLLHLGEVDVATAPITCLFEHPEWRALPCVSIATRSAALSVILCTRSPDITMENLNSLYLDMESRTSAQLIKVLLACKYGRDLNQVQFISPIPTAQTEAKLLIGDKALREQLKPSWTGAIYDLGREWTEWTKLPFVFACWMTRKQSLTPDFVAMLQRCITRNLADIDSWIENIEGFDSHLLKEYFTQNMNYGFGRAEQEGLITFHQYLRELELVDKPFDLRFVNL